MLNEINIKARDPDCIRVIQITDTHIFESAGDRFDGLDTSESLNAVIEHILLHEQQQDLILVTGDLVHSPSATSYLKLRQLLFKLRSPMFCLPGNHDDPVLMHSFLNKDHIHTNKVIVAGEWELVLLDTYLAGSGAGRLSSQELIFLDQALQSSAQKFSLVCLHHPPVPIESRWMDAMMLENADDLFTLLDKHPKIRALIWGHIHQEFRGQRHGVILYGSPSTGIQFTPGSEQYIKDDIGPGYSVLNLYDDGQIEIETIKIK